MSKYKYPFIPKEYFQAVMYACKLLRWGKGRQQAVSLAARAYGVDEEGVSEHLAARSAAGQKGKKKAAPKYYVMSNDVESELGPYTDSVEIFTKTDAKKIMWERTDLSPISAMVHHVIAGPFASKQEAKEFLIEWVKVWDKEHNDKTILSRNLIFKDRYMIDRSREQEFMKCLKEIKYPYNIDDLI